MVQSPVRQGMGQGANDVFLSDQAVKRLWPPFACEYLISHGAILLWIAARNCWKQGFDASGQGLKMQILRRLPMPEPLGKGMASAQTRIGHNVADCFAEYHHHA